MILDYQRYGIFSLFPERDYTSVKKICWIRNWWAHRRQRTMLQSRGILMDLLISMLTTRFESLQVYTLFKCLTSTVIWQINSRWIKNVTTGIAHWYFA